MARSFEPTAAGMAALAPYWSSFVSARSQGLRSTDMWGIMQEAFQAGGPALEGATIFDVNAMWARAGETLTAAAAFGNASPGDAVTGDHWAWAPWATPDTAAWQTPTYMINYAVQGVDAEGNLMFDETGNPVPVWGATDWQGSLDVTVQDVLDRIQGSATAALDTGSPGMAAQMAGQSVSALGQVLTAQIMRF